MRTKGGMIDVTDTKIKIAPSILAADMGRLTSEVEGLLGADWIHVDVMDGHFVPNITFGPDMVAALRKATRLPLDVHLMIEAPARYIERFIQAGADSVTVHVEADRHLHSTIQQIARLGARVGVALNPATPVTMIEPVLSLIDLILVMTVNPGFGGQRFLVECLPKIQEARALARRAPRAVDVQVDGGIDEESIALAAEAGANVFVAGTAVFKTSDPNQAIDRLRQRVVAR